MSMTTRILHTGKIFGLIAMIGTGCFSFQSCNKSKVSAGGSSIYANPTAIDFTPEHLVFMLKLTYSNFNSAAPRSDLDAILNAADDDAAKEAYDKAIDTFVNAGTMSNRWKEYARSAVGAGSGTSGDGNDEDRYPENLFSKVLLSGDPISEFFLADYAVDDDGNEVSQEYAGGPVAADGVFAGYMTTEIWTDSYLNQFKFKAAREALGFGLCVTMPNSKIPLYEWTEEEINPTYTESGGIKCHNCHKNMNPVRFAWHNFAANGNYTANTMQNNNQYGMEANNGGGLTLEPLDVGGLPLDDVTAETTKYKLTTDGVILSSPRVLAQEITKNNQFPRCMVERFLSVFFNIDEGHPGQNYVAPDNFSSNEAQVEFMDEMVTKFNELNQVPKDFFKFFLKDKRYLILAVNPNDLGD